MKTLILGVGNAILGDDGVGLQVARKLQAAMPSDAPIDVQEACCGGLALMERMVGFQHVILIDALQCEDEKPGTVFRLTLDELQSINRYGQPAHLSSSHDTTLIEALNMGKAIGLHLPQEIIIYGIVIVPVWVFSDVLTAGVETAVPQVASAIQAELNL
ncbi:MAG: hydrogenase maturation protease [Chloroflexi bacterium]|nr:hydrogenase maturation protease [Chloroflexota bacterium]